MNRDKLIMLYIDLCDNKKREAIRSMVAEMRKVALCSDRPIITAVQGKSNSKCMGISMPDIDSVYTKISDYTEEINRNTNLFYKKRRSWFMYHITKAVIRIRYFFWIIWWYIKN